MTDTHALNPKRLLEANRRLSRELAQRDGQIGPSPWRQHHNLNGEPKRSPSEDEVRAAEMSMPNAKAYRCDWCGQWHLGRLRNGKAGH